MSGLSPLFTKIIFDYLPLFALLMIVWALFNAVRVFVGRRLGFYFLEFSFGVGPLIFSRTDKSGTHWTFRLLPLTTSSFASSGVTLKNESISRRIIKELIMNYIGAIVLIFMGFCVLFSIKMVVGHEVSKPIIGKIQKGSAAEKAGLQVGDEVLSLNKRKIVDFYDLSQRLFRIGEQSSLLTIRREGRELDIPVKAERKSGRFHNYSYSLGINRREMSTDIQFKKFSVAKNMELSAKETYGGIILVLNQMTSYIDGKKYFDYLHAPMVSLQIDGRDISSISLRKILDFALSLIGLSVVMFIFYTLYCSLKALWLIGFARK